MLYVYIIQDLFSLEKVKPEPFVEQFREIDNNILEKGEKDKKLSETVQLCKAAKENYGRAFITLFYSLFFLKSIVICY